MSVELLERCQGCAAPLAPRKGPGRRAKWCSDRCRKTTLYSATCETCGRRDNGSEGKRDSYICGECAHEAEYGERNRRVFEAWQRGETAPEIAAREGGMTAAAVGSLVECHRKRNGTDLLLHRRPNRELWPDIQRMWEAGLSGHEIAAALDTKPQNVWEMVQTMRASGATASPRRPRYSDDDRAEVLRLYRSGLSFSAVAGRCGFGRTFIARTVSQAGISQAGISRSLSDAQKLRAA